MPELLRLAREGVAELGLHIVLNSEWHWYSPGANSLAPLRWGPVLPRERVPSLVLEDGTFRHTPMDHHQVQASTDEMAAEVEAQLRKALAAGLPLTYADEHMGVGWLPGLREKLQVVVARYGLKYADAKASFAWLPQAPGSFDMPWATLAAQILHAPEGDYLYVSHPNRLDEDAHRMTATDSPPGKIAAERDLDRQMLQHPDVRSALQQRGAQLIQFRDVL